MPIAEAFSLFANQMKMGTDVEGGELLGVLIFHLRLRHGGIEPCLGFGST
jgi:hypothetical protein